MDLLENNEREITQEEARKFSREINEKVDLSKLPKDPYFETSSLNGTNVTAVFEYIFDHCLPLDAKQRKMMNSKGGFLLSHSESTEETKQPKKCC